MKKLICVLLAAAMAGAFLAGCSGQNDKLWLERVNMDLPTTTENCARR